MTEPNNSSTEHNPVGRFMVASGAVIELETSGNILLIQRSANLDWQPNEWEIPYGRIAQFEDPEAGLKREVAEEVGITQLEILDVLTAWHIYRGQDKLAENELVGITYHCRTTQTNPIISDEHQAYAWLTPAEALQRVSVEGIRRDIEKFTKG